MLLLATLVEVELCKVELVDVLRMLALLELELETQNQIKRERFCK